MSLNPLIKYNPRFYSIVCSYLMWMDIYQSMIKDLPLNNPSLATADRAIRYNNKDVQNLLKDREPKSGKEEPLYLAKCANLMEMVIKDVRNFFAVPLFLKYRETDSSLENVYCLTERLFVLGTQLNSFTNRQLDSYLK